MAIGSLKDLYLDELSDLYDAELQIVRTLPRLAEAAHHPELRKALARHSEESRLHLERLDLIFTHWGARRGTIVHRSDRHCSRSRRRVHDATTNDARDATIIGAAQRIEHYEMAAYAARAPMPAG